MLSFRLVRARWLLVVFGPALLLIIGSILALIFLPHPVPKTATPVQRLYLSQCATCHGANGRGSWHATLFLVRPGDLSDPRTLANKTDAYVFDLIKNGGATIGTASSTCNVICATNEIATTGQLAAVNRAPRLSRRFNSKSISL